MLSGGGECGNCMDGGVTVHNPCDYHKHTSYHQVTNTLYSRYPVSLGQTQRNQPTKSTWKNSISHSATVIHSCKHCTKISFNVFKTCVISTILPFPLSLPPPPASWLTADSTGNSVPLPSSCPSMWTLVHPHTHASTHMTRTHTRTHTHAHTYTHTNTIPTLIKASRLPHL